MSKKRLLDVLGPGLLYAGAAIGVSHLVQSTRAGAEFGLQLIGIIVLANLIKYPFFQIGPRYAAATGQSLLKGYWHLHPLALLLATLLTVATMFTVQAAVTIVTAGLAIQMLGLSLSAKTVAAALLAVCCLVLFFGRYSLLDKLMKFVIIALSVTTLGALAFAWGNPVGPVENPFSWADRADVLFLVALVGWMPAPIDLAIWHSMWTLEKRKANGGSLDMRSTLLDFNVGFFGTLALAVGFVLLGYFVMYGREIELLPQAGRFAGQLIQLYTQSLGDWAFPLIAIAAFTTMFSTTLTCLDAFPRVMGEATTLLAPRIGESGSVSSKGLYSFWMLTTAAGAVVILFFFISNMKAMVTLATVLAFVLAPIFATLNYLVMRSDQVPEEYRMGPLFQAVCLFGICAFLLFSGLFIYYRF